MSRKPFEGIITPLLSPLDRHERIIEKDLVKLVRYQLGRGINGFLAPSGTGEFFSLSAEERRRVVEIVADEVRGRVPVIAMVGDCGTRQVLEHVWAAREAGADAVMAPPVYFTVVDQDALKTFYKTIAAESDMPVWLYQQPQETKLWLKPETVAELAEIPNIVGIKVSCAGDLLNYHQILRALRHKPSFRILMGEDHNTLAAFVLGGHGAVATLANLIPDEFLTLWKSARKGDLATARRMQSRIMDVQDRFVFRPRCFQSACKLVLQQRGIFSTTFTTSPLPPLTGAERKATLADAKRLRLC